MEVSVPALDENAAGYGSDHSTLPRHSRRYIMLYPSCMKLPRLMLNSLSRTGVESKLN